MGRCRHSGAVAGVGHLAGYRHNAILKHNEEHTRRRHLHQSRGVQRGVLTYLNTVLDRTRYAASTFSNTSTIACSHHH